MLICTTSRSGFATTDRRLQESPDEDISELGEDALVELVGHRCRRRVVGCLRGDDIRGRDGDSREAQRSATTPRRHWHGTDGECSNVFSHTFPTPDTVRR